MDRETELELIDEMLALKRDDSFFLDADMGGAAVANYLSTDQFEQEQRQIFAKLPLVAAHQSELAAPGDFITRDLASRSVLLTRHEDGTVRAFLNICRHRGTQLVDDTAGCKRRFSCPYHGWTYDNAGQLIAAPHFDAGFSGLAKDQLGLTPLPCAEKFGLIWVGGAAPDIEAFLGTLGSEIAALKMDDMAVVASDRQIYQANWKILLEGGIEAYHFKTAHRDTIAPYFEDNLSTYRVFGPHMRSVLMRNSMVELRDQDRASWRLRDHAQLLYTLFPTTTLLVQKDHIVLVQSEPLTVASSRVSLITLAPVVESENAVYWQRNHAITRATLAEDFAIGESIQAGLASGANDRLIFGRFEGALTKFHQILADYLGR